MDDLLWDEPRPCAECGEEFRPVVHNQKRHPHCELLNRRRQRREYMERRRQTT
jgi:hypothetical protein